MQSELTLMVEQTCIEDKYSKHNIHTNVRKDLNQYESYKQLLIKGEELVQAYLDKHSEYFPSKQKRVLRLIQESKPSVSDIVTEVYIAALMEQEAQTIQSMCGKIASNFNFYDDPFDAIKTSAELIAVLTETNLYDIFVPKNSSAGGMIIKSNFSLSKQLERYIRETMYLPPMICEPVKVNSITDSGYLTKNINTKDSLILGKNNYHDKKISTDVINKLNSIPLEIDTSYAQYYRKPDFSKYTAENRNTMQIIDSITKDLMNGYMYPEKQTALENRSFWLTWKFDFRGRFYSQGYHINIQGDDDHKACINLARKEIVTQ